MDGGGGSGGDYDGGAGCDTGDNRKGKGGGTTMNNLNGIMMMM